MSFKSRHLALIAVVAGAVAPTSALAMRDAPRGGQPQKPHCGIDYSRNSVNGQYCDPVTASTPVSTPTTSTPIVVAHDSSFSWGDAGVGAGAAIALMGVGAGGAIALRRRNPGKPLTS
jgi:hypothetical protein